MPETAFFAPEIEELLREVASDPRSTLLRVPRPKVLRTFFEHDPTVSQHATGLRSAERELLRTHREELAQLLREACVLKLHDHPSAKGRMLRHVTATRVLSIPNRVALRGRFARARPNSLGPLSIHDSLLLDACTEVDGVDQPTIGQLASLSLRLRPTTPARLYVAKEAIIDSRSTDALRLLDAAASFNEVPMLVGHIECDRGAALSDMHRLDESRCAYSRAADQDDPPLMAVISWLTFSVRTAFVEGIRASSTKLGELVDDHHPSIRDAEQGIRSQRNSRPWVLSHDERLQALKLCGNCGTAARRIMNAMLE